MNLKNMLKVFSYFSIAVIILFNTVSCVYMQAKKNDTKQNLPDNSGIQENDNMSDMFKISETVEQNFTVNSKTKIKLNNFDGDITVKTGNTSVVKLRVTKKALDQDASDGVKYNFSQKNGTINLDADFVKPDRKINYGKTYFLSKGAYVNWELIVPVETDINIETDKGQINIEGVDGDLTIATTKGSLTLKDCKGHLDATTFHEKVQITNYEGNAQIVHRGRDPILIEGKFDNLSVETGGGDISLGLAKSSGGIFETDNENISVKNLDFQQTGKNPAGWKKYSFGKGDSNIKIQSGRGKISLYSL